MKKGFTLIEVLVVIAIIATLSGIIYASFNGTRAQSRDQKRVSDIHELQLVLEQYFNAFHYYPPDIHDLIVKGYIASIPSTPSNYSSYNYFPITQTNGSTFCTSYQLWTKLETTSSYLASKKGFNSSSLPASPTQLFACGNLGTPIDAASDPLIYDVTP